jgi:DNA-binding PadR family transcriptional regulator
MKLALRRASMLRWMAREPWLTAEQLAALMHDELKTTLNGLRVLGQQGCVQRANIGESGLPSANVYALADNGLQELARVEGRSCGATSLHYGLSASVLLNTFNRLPFIWSVRQYLLRPLTSARRANPPLRLTVWSWRRRVRNFFVFNRRNSARHGYLPADAYGVLVSHGDAYPFFVIWDHQGTAPPETERQRLAMFYRARDSGDLPLDWLHFPALFIIASSRRRAVEYRALLLQFGERYGESALLPAFVAEKRFLAASGPLALIWTRPGHGEQRVGCLVDAPHLPEKEYLRAFGREQWSETRWAEVLKSDSETPRRTTLLGAELNSLNDQTATTLPQRLALANLRLQPHEKDVLKWLGAQGAVLTSHVRRYFAREGETVRVWLARLMRYGLIAELTPPAEITTQKLYALTDAGLTWMALKENQPPERYRRQYRLWRPAAPPTEPDASSGASAYTWRLLRHHLEVAERMLAFAEAARAETRSRRSKQSLEVWDGEARAAIVWRDGRHIRRLRPDAHGVYCIGTESVRFWLEVDRSRCRLHSATRAWYSFEQKVSAYYTYFNYLKRLGLNVGFPTLLIITTTLGRVRSLRRLLVETASQLDMSLIPPVYVTSARLFERFGPLAPIWRTPLSNRRVRCFEGLEEPPPSARFSPLVTPKEFEEFVGPMLKEFIATEFR